MSDIIYTPQLFIFDTLTWGVIVVATILMYLRTRELYSLSLQKGVKYFSNAMLFYIISFGIRYVTIAINFIREGRYGAFEQTVPGLILVLANIYMATLGGFYMGYSLVWRKFEIDRFKRFHLKKVFALYMFAFLIVAADVYLIYKYKFITAFIFFGTVILFLFWAIISNYTRCCGDSKSKDINPFLALVGLSLGVYIFLFIEALLINTFFTIHYYTTLINTIFAVTILYHIYKIIRLK
jgi:hypothetical protein